MVDNNVGMEPFAWMIGAIGKGVDASQGAALPGDMRNMLANGGKVREYVGRIYRRQWWRVNA